MGVSRSVMIKEIGKHKDKYGQPYTHIYTKDGRTSIKDAPDGNLFYAYLRITGRGEKVIDKILAKEKRKREEQLTFDMV